MSENKNSNSGGDGLGMFILAIVVWVFLFQGEPDVQSSLIDALQTIATEGHGER